MRNKKVLAILATLLLGATGALAASRQGSFEGRIQGTSWVHSGDRSDSIGVSADYLAHYTQDIQIGGRAELPLTSSGFSVLAEVIRKLPDAGGIEPYFGGLLGPVFHSGDARLKLGGLLGASKRIDANLDLFAEFQMGLISGGDDGSYFALGVGAKFNL